VVVVPERARGLKNEKNLGEVTPHSGRPGKSQKKKEGGPRGPHIRGFTGFRKTRSTLQARKKDRKLSGRGQLGNPLK